MYATRNQSSETPPKCSRPETRAPRPTATYIALPKHSSNKKFTMNTKNHQHNMNPQTPTNTYHTELSLHWSQSVPEPAYICYYSVLEHVDFYYLSPLIYIPGITAQTPTVVSTSSSYRLTSFLYFPIS
ncbi:unnamed protein product [Pieris macdunnoughi]|uniref:Uncharacterized protein n=1 Tax=Pieris macdunnoughi TaxID=345717 RepID=A0A821LG99_9NEOP|nr:unnamed protein product [Pieris macdunnoughi]